MSKNGSQRVCKWLGKMQRKSKMSKNVTKRACIWLEKNRDTGKTSSNVTQRAGKPFESVSKWNRLTPLWHRAEKSLTADGMGFLEIPQHLKDFHQVEWRLVSPRAPILKVFAARRDGQTKMREDVACVPCDAMNIFQAGVATFKQWASNYTGEDQTWFKMHKPCGVTKYAAL